MAIKLTWDDLLIEASDLDPQILSHDWSWLVKGPFKVVAASKFGDWFIQRPHGAIEIVDAVEGTLREVAATHEEFLAVLLGISDYACVPGPGAKGGVEHLSGPPFCQGTDLSEGTGCAGHVGSERKLLVAVQVVESLVDTCPHTANRRDAELEAAILR